MEQKLTIHKNKGHLPALPAFWALPRISSSLWNPVRFNPFGWNEDIEDLFDNTRRNMNRMLENLAESIPVPGIQPQTEVSEDQKSLRIDIDLPGLKAEDLDISTKDDVLTISADKQEKRNGTESHYSFSYATTLPEGANINAADVNFANQRLSIEIPKKNGAKKLSINVENSKREKKTEARKEKSS